MLNIGIIGVGGIAQTHIRMLKKVEQAKICAICDINEERLQKVGDQLEIPTSHRFTDYKDLIACPDVQAVEICTPNYLHIPMAMDVVRAGKAVEIEKPLSVDYNDVEALLQLIEEKGVVNMTCFSYRFRPAVRYARQLIQEGKLGDIIHANVAYLKSSGFWAGRRLDWRFEKQYAGCGVIGDLGVHLMDMVSYLAGEYKSVYASTDIIVKQRQKLDSDDYAPVETEDVAMVLATLKGGAKVNFQVSRCAIGNSNTIRFEMYGTKGMLRLDIDKPNELELCMGTGTKDKEIVETITVPDGYDVSQEETFVRAALGEKLAWLPDVAEGAKCQKFIDAMLESARTDSVVRMD